MSRSRALLPIFAASLVVAIAAYLRTFQIETRPLHSDESVNFLFVETTNRLGYYPYSHVNYHGPLFFYIITGLVNLVGDSVLGLRLGAIFFGVAATALIFGFWKLAGFRFCLLAAVLVAISPSNVFFSRYAIHESLLVFGTLGLALSVYWWCLQHHAWCWYTAAVSCWIMVATKETFPIAGVSIVAAALSLGSIRKNWATIRSQTIHIFLAYLAFVILVLGTFSSGFRWVDGIGEMFMAFPQWVGRSTSDVGHHKEPKYYLSDVIWQTELPLIPAFVLAGIAVIGAAIVGYIRNEPASRVFGTHAKLARFLAVWTVITTVVYSLVQYKTVWLIINMSFPALLFSACLLTGLLESTLRPVRFAGWMLSAVTIFILGRSMLKYNFVEAPIPLTTITLESSYPYGQQNPFSYVHTSPGTLELVKLVDEYIRRKPTAKVLIAIEGYFPLPYYLRHRARNLAYLATDTPEEYTDKYDILVMNFHKTRWTDPGWVSKYHRLSDYAEASTFFRNLDGFPPPDAPGTAPKR